LPVDNAGGERQFVDCVNKLTASIYHFVHTNGLLADWVYSSAHYTKRAAARVRSWRIALHRVAPEALWPHRHLTATSSLTTGVTNICNAKCSFCAYPKAVQGKTLQQGVMPFDVFKKAVDEWAASGGQSVDLTPVVGDPLIDPNLLEKIHYAVHQAGIKNLALTTNAILMNRNDTHKRLVDSGIHRVFISTEGTSREMYEKIYGVKQYDEVISGVRNLLDYNRSRGEPVHIAIRFRNAQRPSTIVRSEDFKKNIKPYLSPKVRVNFTVDYDNWGGTIRPEDLKGFMRLRPTPPKVNAPCVALFGFAVRHDGAVRLCGCRFKRSDIDDLIVGNIREQTLEEISKSERAWEIIKGFYSGKRPETCAGCTMYRPIDREWLRQRARNGN
jgi:radical SAM protein with 4Fe4S-binding SPASM domain